MNRYYLSALILGVSVAFAGSEIEFLRVFSYSSTVLIIVFYIYCLAAKWKLKIGLSAFISFTLLLWTLGRIVDSTGFIASAYVGGLSVLCAVTEKRQNFRDYKYPYRALCFVGILACALFFTHSGIFENSNYVSALVALMIFPYLFYYGNKIYSIIFFVILLLIGTRSVILSIFVAILLQSILKSGGSYKIKALSLIGTFVFVSLSIYMYQWYLVDSSFLNSVFLHWTGKRLESGRVEMWMDILSDLRGSEWLIGTGFSFGEKYTSVTLSEHSSYVYFIYRYGIIGLILFISVLISVAVDLIRSRSYASFILFAGFALRDLFEKTIAGNSFPMAVFFWLVCGSGILDWRHGNMSTDRNRRPG